MFVSSLKDNYVEYDLPERFVNCLPEFCDTCGAPMEISANLTSLHCSNPRCKDKMVMRIKALCGDLGILTFGEKAIEKFLDAYTIDSPMDIFGLQEGDSMSPYISQKVSDCIILQLQSKKKMLLWEYVMYNNIPNVRTSAREIFQGYSTIEEAISDIEYGGVPFIQKKLGIETDGSLSVRAIKVYNSIMEYKEDLLKGTEYIEIVHLGDIRELNVVCSDQVGGQFTKKAEFYSYVNNKFSDKVHVNFLPSVNKNIDYLVWAGADGSPARYTSKVKTVEGYNSRGYNIPILTAEQFISLVESW